MAVIRVLIAAASKVVLGRSQACSRLTAHSYFRASKLANAIPHDGRDKLNIIWHGNRRAIGKLVSNWQVALKTAQTTAANHSAETVKKLEIVACVGVSGVGHHYS